MSGHSKWNNIKRRKGAADAERAKIFTKLGREIQVAVKSGGADPETNSRLKDVIAKAKSSNMPNDNIQRSISKASGSLDGDNYEEIVYEGYGPSGIAVLVRTLTDNRNRTAGDVRHLFDKCGGNLGTNGCVSFMFNSQGRIFIARENYENEDQVMMDALEAGAEDFESDEEIYTISTTVENFDKVKTSLDKKSYTFEEASIEPVPDNYIILNDDTAKHNMEKLIDLLNDHDDVQEIFHNWEE